MTISPSAPPPPEPPIGAGPYPPRPDPWTTSSGSWPVRTEGYTTGTIPVVPADPPRSLRPALVTGITLGWLLTIGLTLLLGRIDGIRGVALFGHLVFLAIGFGAVLAIGLNGLALLVRWVRVSRVVNLAVLLDPLIWLGLGGLALTGLLLDPNLDSLWTWLKLVAVLVVGINGLAHRDLMIELGRLPTKAGRRSLSPALLGRAVRVSATTQVGWWLAVLIGYLS